MPKLYELRVTRPFADKFREIVSGSRDGRPDWVNLIKEGNGPGLFGPESAVWQVHGCVATLVGGIRALLLQAAHPAPLAGVSQHSRYESDPLGRLAGTTRWLTITSFASKDVIFKEAARVNAMHSKVLGKYEKPDGTHGHYRAQDARFLLWVHCAFTDSFLKAHLGLGYHIDKGANQYVREWSQSAIPLGLHSAPQSVSELEATLEDFRKNDLGHIDATDDVVKFILNPPFPKAGLLFYRVLANAAIASLHPNELEILRLKRKSSRWLKAARIGLNFFSAILGPESPSMVEAKARVRRSEAD